MFYKNKPKNFKPLFKVVGSFLEYNHKVLLLHRQDHKPQGNTWGVPAGKIDTGETCLKAMIREIDQETGITLQTTQISYIDKVYVRYPDYDFIYYTYHVVLTYKHCITINNLEHKDYRWVYPQEALDMNLIKDLDLAIKTFYKL